MQKPPSQRQLKVAEQIKKALSEMFLRGEIILLDGISITVSLVKISPDLHNVTAYIMPLGGSKNIAQILEILKASSGFIRTYVAKHVELRTAPYIMFREDDSFAEAERITKLLHKVNDQKQ
jgi:ribosome-binding factor A